MSALLISAVDSATDKLTHVAHGFNTGDGPIAAFTPDGTYPGGLAAVTDYWVIRVDADHIKLATSSGNALANVPIDITTNGTGTLYALVGIPYRRARTYGVLAEVKSADLNAMMDGQQDLWSYLTGQAQATYFEGITLAGGESITLVGGNLVLVGGHVKRGLEPRTISIAAGRQWDTGTAMTRDATHDMVTTTASTNVYRVPIELKTGIERLTDVLCAVEDTGADVLTMKVWKDDWSGVHPVRTQLGATAASAGAAGAIELLDSGAIAELAGTLCSYFIEFTTVFAAGVSIGPIQILTDVP